MVARIFTDFRKNVQDNWTESFGEVGENYYFFIGKNDAWADENNPDTPQQSIEEFYKDWDDLLAVKKIPSTNLMPIVKRYDWTSGTIYTAYDSSDTDLFSKKFYVLNSAYGVYKCISNNGGIASTVEPTGTGTSLIVTGDGYVWKYMYTIGTSDAANFLLNDWMPVKTNSTVAAAAVDGAIEYIKVTNGGTGYTSATASIVTTSSGSGAVLTPVISGGIITGITVTTKGTLYRNATVNIVRTGGSGVAATATVSVTPFGGHGKDAPRELGCRHLLVLVDLQGDESGFFPVGDDYRKIGVIHNPKESDGTTLATNDRYAAASLYKGSGYMLYKEHRRSISRTLSDAERFRFILPF